MRLTPAAVAVRVTAVGLDTVPAVAVNVALEAPAGTLTEAGTGRAAWLEDRLTANAAVAALVSATVHVVAAPEVSVAGVQLKPESATGAARPRANVRLPPLRLAVSVAVASLVTVVAVAVNVALEAPAATLTEAGTVTAA